MVKLRVADLKKKSSNLSKALTSLMTMPIDEHRSAKTVKPWIRSVFLVYDYGQTGMFYYLIPAGDIKDQREFDRITFAHGMLINVHDDKKGNLIWLHDQLMDKTMIYDEKGNAAKKHGKWYKHRIPSKEPFGIKGDFLVISTGFAD